MWHILWTSQNYNLKNLVYTYVYPNVYIVHIDLSKKVINKMVALMKG